MLRISNYSDMNKDTFKDDNYSLKENKHIKQFFKDMKRSYDKINTLSFNYELFEIMLDEYEIRDLKYFPSIIQDKIRKELKYIYTCYLYLRNRSISINLVTSDKNNSKYEKYIFMMLMWLDILGEYAEEHCTKNIKIYIYLCDKCKELPEMDEDIDVQHINSGYSYAGCNENSEITVYRKEEWFKVFIHETIHAFNLGFELLDSDYINRKLYNEYPLKIDFYAPECYCESWAVIWNCIFNAFILEKVKFKNFYNKFIQFYNMECNFTNNQCQKISRHKRFDFNNLSHENNYKENTPIFSYFFLKRLLLLNMDNFLNYCDKNNSYSMMKFNKDKESLDNFLSLLVKKNIQYKNYSLNDKSARMTLIDFE